MVEEEAAKDRVKAVVHIGTTAVYGIQPAAPIKAETPLRPVETYGKSKLAGERIMAEICGRHGILLITIRHRATLGEGRMGSFQILFAWIRENRKVYVIGSGGNRVQLIHAHDQMDFYMLED